MFLLQHLKCKFLSIIFSVVLLLCFSCVNDINKVNKITSKTNEPDESAQNVELVYSENGKIQVILKTPLLNKYGGENPYILLPNGLNVDFYDSTFRITSKLTAKYAIRYEKQKKFEAKNDVIVINEKNEKLNTEHLIWSEFEKKIYTNSFVKITTKDEILYGEGFESDDRFDRWIIKKPKGSMMVKK